MASSRYGIKTRESRSFRDVALSFSRNPLTGDINILKDENAIKNAVKNIVLTKPGEKLFEPNFGSRVTDLLFEPFDVIIQDQMETEIRGSLSLHEPRIEVQNVNVNWLDSSYEIEVTIEYRIIGEPLIREIAFLLEPR
jgi:phage baseplate assembly protein W